MATAADFTDPYLRTFTPGAPGRPRRLRPLSRCAESRLVEMPELHDDVSAGQPPSQEGRAHHAVRGARANP